MASVETQTSEGTIVCPSSQSMESLANLSSNHRDLAHLVEEVAQGYRAPSQEVPEALWPEAALRRVDELHRHLMELQRRNEELSRKELEREVALARYFSLFELAPVGYLTLSREGLIVEANLTAAKLLGVPRGILVRQAFTRFVAPEDHEILHRHRLKLFEGHPNGLEGVGEPQTYELRMLTAAGKIFWGHLVTARVGGDDTGTKCRLMLSDVSVRKQSEEERRKLEERMGNVQKLEALGVLVSGVAHNMNNVLAAIMGTSSWREKSTSDLVDVEAYRDIGVACKRGREVLTSLVQFARPSLSKPVPLDLAALLSEVRVLLDNTTRHRFQILETASKQPVWIQGDVGSISCALMSLCLSGLDAMPEGGVLMLRLAPVESDWVDVCIEDRGEGMSSEILARVFEPFFTAKPELSGDGLGLSMAHGVIKAHGGSLDIATQPGKGTAVRVRLPRIPGPIAPKPIVREVASVLGALSVLLVDDDEGVRHFVAKMLEQEGFEVKAVGGGQEALECLGRMVIPDIIILDQNMPTMNGIQTMEKILDMNLDVPILISSGQPGIEDWECFKRPKVAVISKPFDMEEILAKLVQVFQKSRVRQKR